MTDPKLRHITLTAAAAHELALLAAQRGLLTKPAPIRRVARFARDHLASLPELPRGGSTADLLAWSDAVAVDAEVPERVRDALKALVQAGVERGVVSCTSGSGDLLAELGLVDEDG